MIWPEMTRPELLESAAWAACIPESGKKFVIIVEMTKIKMAGVFGRMA